MVSKQIEKVGLVNLQKQEDVLDLFALFETLWVGRWIIVTFVCVSLVLGFSYNFYKKKSLPDPHFRVLATYSVNLFRPLHSQVCKEQFNFAFDLNQKKRRDLDCVRERISYEFESLARDHWSKNSLIEQEWKTVGLHLGALKPDCREGYFCLVLNTRVPLAPEIYERQLQNYNEILTDSISKEVKEELSFQFKQNAKSILASEAYAENVLKLRRLLNGIERGQMALNFEKVKIGKVTPPYKQNLIMAFSFVLGGALGCVLVLFREVISKRRKALI